MGVSMVDQPAHEDSLIDQRWIDYYGEEGELEQRVRNRGLRGSFKYNSPRTTSDRGKRRKESIKPGAFQFSLNDVEREITLQVGTDPGKVLASKRAGTLKLKDTNSELRIDVAELPDTTYARDLRSTA